MYTKKDETSRGCRSSRGRGAGCETCRLVYLGYLSISLSLYIYIYIYIHMYTYIYIYIYEYCLSYNVCSCYYGYLGYLGYLLLGGATCRKLLV